MWGSTMRVHSTPDLLLELQGFRLTTAEILYRIPDYPDIIQSYIWQELDVSPDFPRLHAFLVYWEKNLEGKLYSVKVAQSDVIGISKFQIAKTELTFH
jgi:uncharacterized protein Usg